MRKRINDLLNLKYLYYYFIIFAFLKEFGDYFRKHNFSRWFL